MSPEQSHTPATRILRVLPPLVRALAAEVRRAGAEGQITLVQFSALRLLTDRDCTSGEMARRLHVSMPTVTQIVDGLVSRGLAERSPVDTDRRQVRLTITAAGRRIVETTRITVEGYLAEVLSAWPKEQQEALANELEQFLALVRQASAAERT